jgi:probable HAF family extracellular repeat protein
MKSVGNLGGTCTEAMDLNNRGQVVGLSFPAGDAFSRAFLSENGSIQDLGGSLGGSSTGALKVNNAGQAVGFGYLAGDTLFHATLWRQVGQITDLGTIGDDACSRATDINGQGQVIGGDSTLAQCLGEELFTRAFLWEDGAIFDLNTLIPSGSALYLIDPETINDQGEIAGNGVDTSGNQHAFLLIPCDENHPDIESCDYSLVDPATVVEVEPPHITEAQAASPAKFSPVDMMDRIRALRAGRNRRYGLPKTSPQ